MCLTTQAGNLLTTNQTEVVDEVEFELPYGLVGKMLEGFASNQLRKIFDHRRRITIEELVNGV